MARITANSIELEYDRSGGSGEPLLLIGGLGTQLIVWPDDFRDLLQGRGFDVIRFDNRDAGLSTSFAAAGTPDLFAIMGDGAVPPYTLDDMADDAAALLAGLGVGSAHVVGASMGGYIAQLLALRHPEKVRSLVSIMSGPGGADEVRASSEVVGALVAPAPPDREGRIAHSLEIGRLICGPLFDPEERRRETEQALDRAVNDEGTARQLAAIVAAPSRLERLRGLEVPALVVHGDADALIPPENGRLVAGAIPGARLLTFPEMGHDLPRPIWPAVVDAIVEVSGVGPEAELSR